VPSGVSKNLTPEQRSQRARLAALTRWSKEDGQAQAEKANAGLRRKFYNETDRSLPEAERQRRADCAFRAHMARLSFLASKARSLGKDGVAQPAAKPKPTPPPTIFTTSRNDERR
jgi:hypothetical protein